MKYNVAETLPYEKRLLENARSLRREMTPEERHLWYDFLKEYPVKIYKQKIIDRYIVDFYCDSARLVIEIDGLQHETSQGRQYDAERTKVLEQYGLIVFRVDNHSIHANFYDICREIDKVIKERICTLRGERDD